MENNRNLIISALIIIVLIVGAVWYVSNRDVDPTQLEVPGVAQEVVNEELDIEFTYYGSFEGYTLLESPDGANLGDPLLLKAYTLVDADQYADSEGAVGSDLPSISVIIFAEEDEATSTAAVTPAGTSTGTTTEDQTEEEEVSLSEWAAAHGGFTAYGSRTGEPEEVTVDGVSAIRYTSDGGTFTSETYVLNHRGKYYIFIGQYTDEESEIRTAFRKFMSQVYFL